MTDMLTLDETVLLITPENALTILAALRYHEDMMIWNDFEEHVWLRADYDASGKRIGIIDCCFVDDPCPYHAALAQTKEPLPYQPGYERKKKP